MNNAEINSAASPGQIESHLAHFAHAVYNGMFGDRGTDVRSAYEYALAIAQASDNPPAVTTAIFVVTNTIANLLAEMAGQPNKERENV